MKNEIYITEEESKKCQKVADAYAEELEKDDIMLLNVGRYGFVMLQYCRQPMGIDAAMTFTDSREMFHFLWEEWFIGQLIRIAEELHMENMDDDAIFDCLSREKQEELLRKRLYFAEKAGIDRNTFH
ncbi:MAG: hypothetical protein K2K74_02995 [Lachnospiraceae bacterium]|nr:hypothetical protein [Lachnospiraceae bacterium]